MKFKTNLIQDKHESLTVLFCILVLSLITVWAYFPALRGPFLLDDFSSVFPANLAPFNLSELKKFLHNDNSSGIGRPISLLSFSLNYHFFSGESFSFKMTNLLLHLTTAAVIFFLTSTILKRLLLVGKISHNKNQTIAVALCATAIWALHPLQLSTVMYVVQRMTILSALFTSVSLLCYLIARNKQYSGAARAGWYFVFSALFAILAFLSKETGVLIVVYIALIEILLYDKKDKNSAVSILHNSIVSYSAIVTLVVATAVFYAYRSGFLAGYEARIFTLPERLLTQPDVLFMYIKQILLPNISTMSIYHDDFPINRQLDIAAVLSTMGILALASAAFTFRNRTPILCLGIGFFLASHLLESTILPLELVFEHRNYLALLGFALPLSWYFFNFVSRKNGNPVLFCIMFLAITLLTVQTRMRSQEWNNELDLNGIAATHKPMSLRANNAYVSSLLRIGRSDLAREHLDSMTLNFPANANIDLRKMLVDGALGNIDQRLYAQTKQKLTGSEITINELTTLGLIHDYLNSGKISSPSTVALAQLFKTAIEGSNKRLKPGAKAILYARYVDLLTSQNKYDEAYYQAQTIYQDQPNHPEVVVRLAELIIVQNKTELLGDIIPGLNLIAASSSHLADRSQKILSYLNKSNLTTTEADFSTGL